MSSEIAYRSDIDGLRAIAVLSVVFFHLDHQMVPGGYIGVDIFFVISGYLIGTILLREFDAGTFSFLRFFERRIRRLFPAYFVMALATAAVGWFVLTPEDYRQFGQSLLAATIFISNILFYKETGYFNRASEEKPLLHSWSLGVEEQFYIVVPIILALIYFFVKSNTRCVVIGFAVTITIVSFALSVVFMPWDASAVFFLFPFRAWELAIGVLLATGIFPEIKNIRIADIVSGFGAALIAYAIVFYDRATPFPGAAALLPCVGSALVIYGGEQQRPMISRWLSLRPIVLIGLTSYSMYLWHWPVIVLGQQGFFFEQTWGAKLIMLVLMGALTFLSYRFVEMPVRHAYEFFNRTKLFASASILSLFLVAAGAALHLSSGVPSRLSPTAKEFIAAITDYKHKMNDCVSASNAGLPGVPNCKIGMLNAPPTMLVWGDSHALAFHDAIDTMMRKNEVAGIYVQTAGCPPFFGLGKDEKSRPDRQDDECKRINILMEEYLESDSLAAIDKVLFVGRWAYYANGGGVGVDREKKIELLPYGAAKNSNDPIEIFTAAVDKTIRRLAKKEICVFVLEQPPEISNFRPREIAFSFMQGANDISKFSEKTEVPFTDMLRRQGKVRRMFLDLQIQGQLTYLPTHDKFCNDQRCSVLTDKGRPLMIDNNHVTVAGSMVAIGALAPIFQQCRS